VRRGAPGRARSEGAPGPARARRAAGDRRWVAPRAGVLPATTWT